MYNHSSINMFINYLKGKSSHASNHFSGWYGKTAEETYSR